MELFQIAELARAFRAAIEAVPVKQRPIGMQDFPRGACGDASLLLGAYFNDKRVPGFEYVCGERGCKSDNTWTTHAWLQRGACIVDITAGQFQDAPEPVIVANPSLWHACFETEPPRNADFRLWSGYGAEILHSMYARILANIEHSR